MSATKINRTVSLASYSMSFKVSYGNEHHVLSDVGGVDSFDLIKGFLEDARSPRADHTQKAIFKTKIIRPNLQERTLDGVIETGEFGFSARGIDVNTEQETYKRGVHDAEVIPLAFHISLPKGEKSGLVILQRFGNIGISTHFVTALRRFIGEKVSKVTLEWEPLVHPDLINQYASKGKTRKIKFRQWAVPKDTSDALGLTLRPNDAYIEYSIIAKRGGVLGKFSNIMEKCSASSTAMLGLPTGFKPDETVCEVDMNGRSRTIHMGDVNEMTSFYDITLNVDFKSDGHPKNESVLKEARLLANDLFVVMKGVKNV